MIVANIEFAFGIIAACMPTLVPLVQPGLVPRCFRGSTRSVSRTTTNTYIRSRSNGNYTHRAKTAPSTYTDAYFDTQQKNNKSDVPLCPVEGHAKITVSRSYNVAYHGSDHELGLTRDDTSSDFRAQA